MKRVEQILDREEVLATKESGRKLGGPRIEARLNGKLRAEKGERESRLSLIRRLSKLVSSEWAI